MFENFYNKLAWLYSFEIKYKDKSLFMKFLGLILFFNSGFMTQYITTIGKTIYFPTESFIAAHDVGSCSILAHELLHVQQSKNVLYNFLYLFPQILVIFSLLSFFNLWFLLFLAFALPIPAYFRMLYEREAYVLNMFVTFLYMKKIGMNDARINEMFAKDVDFINEQFTSSVYYFMWPFGIKDYLKQQVNLIKNGDICQGSNAIFYRNIEIAFLS